MQLTLWTLIFWRYVRDYAKNVFALRVSCYNCEVTESKILKLSNAKKYELTACVWLYNPWTILCDMSVYSELDVSMEIRFCRDVCFTSEFGIFLFLWKKLTTKQLFFHTIFRTLIVSFYWFLSHFGSYLTFLKKRQFILKNWIADPKFKTIINRTSPYENMKTWNMSKICDLFCYPFSNSVVKLNSSNQWSIILSDILSDIFSDIQSDIRSRDIHTATHSFSVSGSTH